MTHIAQQSSDGKGSRLFFGYLVVFALVLTSFIPLSLGLSCAGIFYTSVAASLGVGVGVLSYYISVLWISTLIFLPLCGRLLARVDARICVTAAVAVMALDFVWLANVHELWQFYTGAFAMGIGVTMLLFLAPSTLINRWFAKRAGFFIGIVMAFTGVGGVVWSTVGGILINSIGWSATYLVFALLCLLTIPATIFCIASSPEKRGLVPFGAQESEDDSASIRPASGTSAQEAFRSRTFILLLVLAFCLNLGMGFYFLMPAFTSTLAVSAANPLLGATAASAAMAGQTISKIVLGSIGDKRPTLGFMIGLGLGLAGIVIFLTDAAITVVIVYAAAFLYGFFYGVTNVMLPIATRFAYGVADYATIYARISMAASAGSIVSGFLWGTIVQLTGSYPIVFIGVAAIIVAAIAIVMLFMRAAARSSL